METYDNGASQLPDDGRKCSGQEDDPPGSGNKCLDQADPEPEDSSARRRVLVAFSGGGAKGLIHVGALRALEDRDVEFCGLAGTSAGAVIAALKAAGFSSRDLVDPDDSHTIISKLKEIDSDIHHITDIFGFGGWNWIRFFRWSVDHLWIIVVIIATVIVAVISLAVISFYTADSSFQLVLPIVLTFLVLAGAVFSTRIIQYLLSGFADMRKFRNAFDKLLRVKMFPDEPDREVKMKDFGRDGRPPLKIVSANLSQRSLKLFSPNRTPDVTVADAVAASICLPMIFPPWKIKDSFFIDGGIVSNLPAWAFDEERELDPDALTIAIKIADRLRTPTIGRHNWLRPAIRTALFGSGELNLRSSGRVEQLVLKSNLDLLQFDLDPATAFQEVRDSEAAASAYFDKRFFRRPELYHTACEITSVLVKDVIYKALEVAIRRVRVAIAMPDPDYHHSLRLCFWSGYDNDPDEGMSVPIKGSVLDQAWDAKESRFEFSPFPSDLDLPNATKSWIRATIWRDLAWELSIPISDNTDRMRLAVHISGDTTLPNHQKLGETITEIECSVAKFFGMIADTLSSLEDDHDLEKHNP